MNAGPKISASQIEAYLMCPRKWGWRSIEKIPGPPNKYAQRGLDLHDIAERFLRDGTMPPDNDAGKVFRAGLPFLPPPGTGMCEGAFEYLLAGEPFMLVGRIDWTRSAETTDIDFLDHKTTSSVDFSWTKTKEDLMTDVQAMVYAAYVMQAKNLRTIRGRWVSYRWTPDRPKAIAVNFEASLEHVAAQMERIKEIAREMAFRVEQKIRACELPFDVASCGAFGGCPYQDKCALSGAERLRGHMSTQMTLKEKMAARALQTPAVNPPATVQAVPTVAAPVQAAPPATPVQAAPVQAVPTVAAPVQAAPPATPVQAAPVQAAPVQATPVQVAPVAAAPVQAAPVAAAPTALAAFKAKKADPQDAPKDAPKETPKAHKVEAPATVLFGKRFTVDQIDDMALAIEMVGSGLKAIAKHLRS